MKNSNQLFDLPSSWIRIMAATSSLIAIFGLVMLFALESFAQNQGFQKGKKTFTNPFADSQSGADSKISVRPPGAQTGMENIPEPKRNEEGYSVGGGPAGGVVSSSSLKPLDVDSYTGAGSKAVITDFNYPDADILDIAKTIGKLTGKNFIFDKNVKGRISIVSNSPITVADAWRAFLTSLDINGFTLIPSGKYIRIARQRDARDKQLNTYTGEYAPQVDTLITRVFPLKHITADEVARTFRSFMPANSRIIPYAQTNTVIVTDTGSNIGKLAQMLEFLDVEGYDAGIEVIAVAHASATELAKLIDSLLPGTQTPRTTTRRTTRRTTTRSSSFAARKTKEGGVINNIIADERTNTLIVHANSAGVEQVRKLVRKLDTKEPAVRGGGKIHVVYLQFADAEEVSKTLNNFSASATTRTNNRTTSTRGNPIQNSGSLFEGSIRVSPDKATNSLVITASPSDFVTVQRVINKLDIPRDEVYVEVVIMELSLGRNSTFSTGVALPHARTAIAPGGTSDILSVFSATSAQKGLVLSIPFGDKQDFNIGGETVEVPNVLGLIKALQTKANANILATPQILTLDNTEAIFETSEKIPVLSNTVSQGVIVNSTTRENISLSIQIKPQINKASNFVKLDIKAKLDDISGRELPADVASKALATFERRTETSVVVADEDTVVIGGLIRDKVTDSTSKIPILGDIPLLGWLFRSRESVSEKTNLVMFITPKIIRQYEKVRAILDEKLKKRDQFIEEATGGKDPMRKYRDEIVRSLPDLKEVLKAQKSLTETNQSQEANPAFEKVQDSGSPFSGDMDAELENNEELDSDL